MWGRASVGYTTIVPESVAQTQGGEGGNIERHEPVWRERGKRSTPCTIVNNKRRLGVNLGIRLECLEKTSRKVLSIGRVVCGMLRQARWGHQPRDLSGTHAAVELKGHK